MALCWSARSAQPRPGDRQCCPAALCPIHGSFFRSAADDGAGGARRALTASGPRPRRGVFPCFCSLFVATVQPFLLRTSRSPPVLLPLRKLFYRRLYVLSTRYSL